MIKNKFKKSFLLLSFVFLFFSFNISKIESATLQIETTSLAVKVGDSVTATVYVNSEGVSINNAEGIITVSPSILEIQSVSTSGSNFNLWVEQPTFSNGVVLFNGGIPNPGYVGSRGKVLTIYMRAISNGTASVNFQSANVRANDGFGTDVLRSKSGDTVVVQQSTPVTPVAPEENVTKPVVPASVFPKTPTINSDKELDSDKWYNYSDVRLEWSLPSDVVAVRTLFNQEPNSDPAILYSPAIRFKSLDELDEGIWYFHLKYQNSSGWGSVAHKKMMIDRTAPELTESRHRLDELDRVVLSLQAEDELSSIEKYVLTVDGESIEISSVDGIGSAEFVFPVTYSGRKVVNIQVFDKAGNVDEESIVVDFPSRTEEASTTEEQKTDLVNDYLWWGPKTIEVLSIVVPILSMVVLLSLIIYILVLRIINHSRKDFRLKKIKKLEKETMLMIDALREDMMEDIRIFRKENKIDDIDEAESILLNNMLLDLKIIERNVLKRLKRKGAVKGVVVKKEEEGK